jgi:Ca2+-binding RTX toxin-like protein
MRPIHPRRPRRLGTARPRGSILTVLALAAGQVLLLGGVAHASSTVNVSFGKLTYTASAGTANDVAVSLLNDTFEVRDNDQLAPGAGCTSLARNIVRCSAVGVTSIRLDTGDLDDVVLTLAPFPTTVFGRAGNDRITTGIGADTLVGDAGDDVLTGGAGADKLQGGANADTLVGEAGNDLLDGGSGPDVLNGGADVDTGDYSTRVAGVTVTLDGLVGDGEPGEGDNVGADVEDLLGGDGNDTLLAGFGTVANDFEGNGGADTLNGFFGDDDLTGGLGGDNLSGGDGRDDLVGDDGADTLLGEAGDDDLDGGKDADTVRGGADDDTLDGGLGPDTITGDAGVDEVEYVGRSHGVTVNLGSGADGELNENDAVGNDVEDIDGTPFADTLKGSDARNRIFGRAGDDVITGLSGDDDLFGGAGLDRLNGGDFNDLLDGGSDADILEAGSGDDRFVGGSGTDLVIYGGFDGYAPADEGVIVTIDGVGGDGKVGEDDNVGLDVENVVGTTWTDFISGSQFDNDLFSGDLLQGPHNGDFMYGGEGNDNLVGSGAADLMDCGAGVDSARSTFVGLDSIFDCETIISLPPL